MKLYCEKYFECNLRYVVKKKIEELKKSFPKKDEDLYCTVKDHCSSEDWEEDYQIYCVVHDESFTGTITEFEIKVYEEINGRDNL